MMKMKTVYLTLFVFLLGIAAGAVFFLNRRIPKEPTTYSNDSTSKWLDDRKKLSACEDNAAQLKKIAQSNQQQELAEKTDLEKQQAQLQAQASVLTQQKIVLEAQLDQSKKEAAKLNDALKQAMGEEKEVKDKETVNVLPAANVVDNKFLRDQIEIKDKIIAQLNKNITDLNNKASKKMYDHLKKADAAKYKAMTAKLEQKAKEFFLRAVGKERLEEQNSQLNKVVSTLGKEHVMLNSQIDDLENKFRELKAGEINGYTEAGNVYMQYGLYDKAIEVYNKAAKIDPNDAQIQLRLGFLYKRVQDEPKEAVYHFKQYLLLAPHAKNRKEVEYMIGMLSPQE